MDNNYPPYVFQDSTGKVQGLLVDTWKAWEKATGRKVIIMATEWSKALEIMKNDEADVIDTVFKTPERQERWAFTKPWVDIPVVVYVDKRITGINEPSLLNGFRVAVKSGDAAIEMLRNIGIQSFDQYSNYEDIIKAVQDHKVAVFCMDLPPARYFLYHYGLEHDFNETITLSSGQFHRAVRKDRNDLLLDIEQGFAKINPEIITQLSDSWLGKPLPETNFSPLIVGIISGTVVLSFLLFIMVILLRRMVKIRTKALSVSVVSLQNTIKSFEESEERYRSLVAESIDGILLTDTEGRICDWNRSMENMTGFNVEDVQDKFIWDVQASLIFSEPNKTSAEKLRTTILSILETGDSTALFFNDEHQISRKNGGECWIQASGFLVRAYQGWRLGAIFRDVTLQHHASLELEQQVLQRTAALNSAKTELEELVYELQTTQKQLVEVEKLAALGNLVAGIAHEINTPLGNSFTMGTFIKQKMENLRVQVEKPEFSQKELIKQLDEILMGQNIELLNLQRGSDLIQSFKLVASDQSSDAPRTFKLYSYVEEIIATLHPRFKSTSHTIELFGDKEIEIFSYPGKIAQILTNLVVNSLTHGFEGLSNGVIQIQASVSKSTISLDYRDNGCGMTEETRKHLWEPFFTTKRGRGGTGLGMYIVHNIVSQALGGQITCDSSIGHGVHFSINFPVRFNTSAQDSSLSS